MGISRITAEVVTGQAMTTSALQQVVLASCSIPDNKVFYTEAIILGKDNSMMPIIAKIYAGGYRATGNAVISGSGNITGKIDPMLTTASFSVVAVGNEVRLLVTAPLVAKFIDWQADFKVFIN